MMPKTALKASPEPEAKVQARKIRRLAILLEMASESLHLYEDEAASLRSEVPANLQEAHAVIRARAAELRRAAEVMALEGEIEALNP
jgi:hypothetical protein